MLARRRIVDLKGNSVLVERRPIPKPAGKYADPIHRPDRTLAAELDELSTRVRRLTPDHRNPEKFFEDRSEISARLQRLAGAVSR